MLAGLAPPAWGQGTKPAPSPGISLVGEATLGADADGLLAAGRALSPTLRATALDSDAAAARASGADALDDPTITDNYQYYRDPGVFSAHTVMLSQAFPLWGKRSLRRTAALADLDASRGRERTARDELDEKIKDAFAQYYLTVRAIGINQEIIGLDRRIREAAAARYGQGGGEQVTVLQAEDEETAGRQESIRLAGEKDALCARLNALIGRPADAPLASPRRPRVLPAAVPTLKVLLMRALTDNPTLAAGNAAIDAARARRTLADRAWYPDVTVAAGPIIQTNNMPAGFAATLGLNVPLPWGREAAGQREAAAELAASRERYDAARLEVEGALGEALARLRAARAAEALLRREAVPQAQAGFRSALAAYGQGRADLAAAIEAARRIHEVALRRLQAQLDAQVQLAAIERLVGGDL